MSREQSLTFDEVAELYDRTRPRYPSALVADLIALSHLTNEGRILEVGCGTGQATLALASRGYRIVCLEPGPNLAALARRNLKPYSQVTVIEQSFESCPIVSQSFDLVFSAQAFHWVAPAVRFTKAAQTLRIGGALAILANCPLVGHTSLEAQMQEVYTRCAPSLTARGVSLRNSLEEDFAASSLFRVLPMRTHRWSRAYSTDEYVDLLQTHSDHRVLDARELSALLNGVREAIAAEGGVIEVEYEARLIVGYREEHRP